MKREQKLGLLVTLPGSSHDPLDYSLKPLYHRVLDEFEKDPYIYNICEG
jgi:hypothetical protein